MALDPIRATNAITESYLGYLATTFHLADKELQDQLEAALRSPGKLIKGPILEATPPFKTGATIEELVQRGDLSPMFRSLRSQELPLDRPLYLHQEEAIHHVIVDDRNIVLATGIGSGKTEAFLVPILDHLFKEREQGRLGPGVRALLLYPMNALANDQVARLRNLLKNCNVITFGRYTGETEDGNKQALEKYWQMHHQGPLENELISREEMRRTPPHILLTNYAMLEYLLLRPRDNVFFDGQDAEHWRFLVLDEVHTYTGAKGIETAMLLRRLKDRVVRSEAGRLRCILTSATLGKGESDFPDVALFAQRLLGEQFEWVANDAQRQDVIAAMRKPMAEAGQRQRRRDPWVYETWKYLIDHSPDEKVIPELVQKGRSSGIPEDVLQTAGAMASDGGYARFLYEALKGDERVLALLRSLEREPQYLRDVGEELFGVSPEAEQLAMALVDLGARARQQAEGESLIPARYHLFVRAVEGAYLALRPTRRLFLERMVTHEVSGTKYAVFEIAACRQCGAIYLVGEVKSTNGKRVLAPPGKQYQENPNKLAFFLLLDGEREEVPQDEDETVGYEKDSALGTGERYKLCSRCGSIDEESLLSPLCDCNPSNYVTVQLVPSKKGSVHSCPACGSRSPTGLVSRLYTGDDATASVLASALYQQIPRKSEQQPTPSPQASATSDPWRSTAALPAKQAPAAGESSGGRQLLIFSDSRQDAAFFAPYLNRTHAQIMWRRLFLQTIEEHQNDVVRNRWRAHDLIGPLRQAAKQLGLFHGLGKQDQEAEVWRRVLYELLAMDRRTGLEGVGCLGFSVAQPEGWSAPRPLMDAWGLSETEVWTLFQVLIDTLRVKGAVLFPDVVSPDDEFFRPRNREYYFRGDGADQQGCIFSWNPSSERALNARLDFLQRLAQRLGEAGASLPCREVLSRLWSSSLAPHDPESVWSNHFSAVSRPGRGIVYRLRPDCWELRPGTIASPVRWYYCDRCNRVTTLNVRGVCPTYRCNGRLRECDPEELVRDNHYRKLYLKTEPTKLVAREHTAQLTSTAAAGLQTDFMEGRVNVLSCSTTFELGVDVGQLETVLMRDVPPSAANYVQRAGRAGRRTDSTAFALTFATRRPHDLYHFDDPKRMVSGEIKPPHFDLANEKIVRRHVYATALAMFWREHPETFGQVSSFFFRPEATGVELLEQFLARNPEPLRNALMRIVPTDLHQRLQIEGWGWVDGLLGQQDGVLQKAAEEVATDVKTLRDAREHLFNQNKRADWVLCSINTIQRRDLLGHMSNRNVIPKYGFPADVVELQVLHHSDEARDIELTRDLRIALSEYAPSSQVVAGGKLWTSSYIKTLPERAWPLYRYAICDHCGHYRRVRAETEQSLEYCAACETPLTGRRKGTFVIPEFGFVTSPDPPRKPGEARPERTYTTRVYYSGESRESDQGTLRLGPVSLEAVSATKSRMAVLNEGGVPGGGFSVCFSCGYAQRANGRDPERHLTPWGTECHGRLRRVSLGHEFETDILQLRFKGHFDDRSGFWLSLLYALLEGASAEMEIDRQDIDGCLYPHSGDRSSPALILFDEVPGGAGHVRRIAQDPDTLARVLAATLDRLVRCTCGGEQRNTSCYGCLRNYRNQFCHHELQRGMVIDFLESLGVLGNC